MAECQLPTSMLEVPQVELSTHNGSPAGVLFDPYATEQLGNYAAGRLDASTSPRFADSTIHSWYTSVMAFPDHLVSSILDSFAPSVGSVFLDPHCGSGTALIEAQKRGLRAFGIDANPCSVLASRVKTNWSVDGSQIRAAIESLIRDVESLEERQDDPIVSYLQNCGMIDRGWIVHTVAVQAAAIKRWIDSTIQSQEVKRFFMLALIASVVKDLSNVKFGPELYCVDPPLEQPDVASSILARLQRMEDDLQSSHFPGRIGHVRLGDSRDGRTMRTAARWDAQPAYVVTSPPYPTEHDYTRNARLELVFMESVVSVESLRRIKRRMIRSHSKGIYMGDRDADLIDGFQPVQEIRRQVEDRVERNASGFEGQYSKVISNYFGGMLRHFRTLSNYMPSGSKLAYIVGDQASYKGVYIPTAHLLAEIIDTHCRRLRLERLNIWRYRRTPKGRQPLREHVMFMALD